MALNFAFNAANRRRAAIAKEEQTIGISHQKNGARTIASDFAKIVCLIGAEIARKLKEERPIRPKNGSSRMGKDCARSAISVVA